MMNDHPNDSLYSKGLRIGTKKGIIREDNIKLLSGFDICLIYRMNQSVSNMTES